MPLSDGDRVPPPGVSPAPELLPPATAVELAGFVALINQWAEANAGNEVLGAVEHVVDDRRWLVRMQGEDKTFITVWLTLGQRTLHVETYFMPAPEENIAACWEYLLRVNPRLYALRFAIGPEDAVYLMGQLPLSAVDGAELDRLVGSAYAYSEQYFRPAMSIGFASRFVPR